MVSKIVVMYSIITFLIIIYNCLKSKIIERIQLHSRNHNVTIIEFKHHTQIIVQI